LTFGHNSTEKIQSKDYFFLERKKDNINLGWVNHEVSIPIFFFDFCWKSKKQEEKKFLTFFLSSNLNVKNVFPCHNS